jgi:hypothetical protein
MIQLPKLTDHGSEIGLLAIVAGGVMVLCGVGLAHATAEHTFDPSAYLVVLTLIVGAIKERWTQRSVDRMGQQLGASAPTPETVTSTTVEGTTP